MKKGYNVTNVSHITEFIINCSTGYGVVFGITLILDHQNMGLDISFSVSLCLVQEILCKIHNSVMATSKMAAMATRRQFCNGFISKNVQGPKLYNCTKFHAFMEKSSSISQCL